MLISNTVIIECHDKLELDYNFPTEMRSVYLNVSYSTKTISLCMWHMIVTCPNESVKIVTVKEMYKHCVLVCQFQLSVHS